MWCAGKNHDFDTCHCDGSFDVLGAGFNQFGSLFVFGEQWDYLFVSGAVLGL